MASYSLYILSSNFWQDAPEGFSDSNILQQLIGEAVALRRRIAKGANVQTERMRYSACLGELESKLGESSVAVEAVDSRSLSDAIGRGEIPCIGLSARYFDLLVQAHLMELHEKLSVLPGSGGSDSSPGSENTGWGSSVYAPWSLDEHLSQLETLSERSDVKSDEGLSAIANDRIQLFRTIQTLGAGVVEAVEELDNADVPAPVSRPAAKLESATPEGAPEVDQSWLSSKGRKRMHDRLAAVINAALPVTAKVNMSEQPHEISTEVLGEFVRKQQPEQESGNIRIVYADGSEASRFPLRVLPPDAGSEPDDPVRIRLALMSMRHVELDPIVDWAWYRNKEVSQTRPLAESDDYCFQFSLDQLSELLTVYDGRSLTLEMYHTGFEPAAIGFYRAVIVTLIRNPGRLRVIPHYFRGGSRFSSSKTIWSWNYNG